MASSVKEMLAAADAVVPRLTPAEFRDMIRKDDVLVVDLRDGPELALGGKIKGAVHTSRGMLEFRADPDSPYYNPAFRKERTVILYCGSGGRRWAARLCASSAISPYTTAAASKN